MRSMRGREPRSVSAAVPSLFEKIWKICIMKSAGKKPLQRRKRHSRPPINQGVEFSFRRLSIMREKSRAAPGFRLRLGQPRNITELAHLLDEAPKDVERDLKHFPKNLKRSGTRRRRTHQPRHGGVIAYARGDDAQLAPN